MLWEFVLLMQSWLQLMKVDPVTKEGEAGSLMFRKLRAASGWVPSCPPFTNCTPLSMRWPTLTCPVVF